MLDYEATTACCQPATPPKLQEMPPPAAPELIAPAPPAGVPAGSVRSYIIIALVFSVCYLAIRSLPIPSDMKDFTMLALGYYFASREAR